MNDKAIKSSGLIALHGLLTRKSVVNVWNWVVSVWIRCPHELIFSCILCNIAKIITFP